MLYIYKTNDKFKINQTKASKDIGITQPCLSNILNGKVACRKVVAFCITKYINKNAEIEDYFSKLEERR